LICRILEFDCLDSTSDHARQLVVAEDPELPLVVRTARQIQGRGRGSHAWWSDAGSLTFTIALDPRAHGLRPDHEPRLALAAAVAIVEAIGTYGAGLKLGIRWPNDIEVQGRKLGGILPERVETDRGPRLLIGIGLNVLTRLVDAPAEVRRMAVSLAELVPQVFDRAILSGLLATILDRWEGIVERLARDDPTLAERWDQLDTLRGQWIRVDLGPQLVEGWGRGIDAGGALRLEVAGQIQPIFGGQVLRD
jgi:BirA family biotin operon repressor/biotin-[acetyl-CoA-carboxylase] ligase